MPKGTVTRVVIKQGQARAVYDDKLAPYLQPLDAKLQRASHVEPDNDHVAGGNFYIDFSPLGGQRIFADDSGKPFLTHSETLAYEKQVVERFWVLRENVPYAGLIGQPT